MAKTWLQFLTAMFTAVISVGCAERSGPPSLSEQTTLDDWKSCLRRSFDRFDDGVSDARVIAQAMYGACSSEHEVFVEAATANKSVSYANTFRQSEAQHAMDFVVGEYSKGESSNTTEGHLDHVFITKHNELLKFWVD